MNKDQKKELHKMNFTILKGSSRVENLLIQNKLPDAAIEGFAGAVKNQIDAMTEEERQML
ncbi:MAG: hypothetical protein CM1200mP28_16660 [Deltaproteobacteria bacterium]|nr:MAG: hypothetical protein CM1200mP28_16660 [Deltaproteobacteria bacterium]